MNFIVTVHQSSQQSFFHSKYCSKDRMWGNKPSITYILICETWMPLAATPRHLFYGINYRKILGHKQIFYILGILYLTGLAKNVSAMFVLVIDTFCYPYLCSLHCFLLVLCHTSLLVLCALLQYSCYVFLVQSNHFAVSSCPGRG